MLVENIICYVCVIVQKKYVPLTFARAYTAAELRVSMLKDNIEINSKEMELISMGTEFNLVNISSKISDINHDIWYEL
jgi:hypothetical protein